MATECRLTFKVECSCINLPESLIDDIDDDDNDDGDKARKSRVTKIMIIIQ